METNHHQPMLEAPRRAPMIHWVADRVALPDAEPLLQRYPELDAADAVALVRAARQYVDGLWVADADPRLAWIKLIGALEAAANRFDDTREETDLDQLRRHRPRLYRALQDAPAEVAHTVAREVARQFNIERKVLSFVKRFNPGPPSMRPANLAAQVDWGALDVTLGVLYEHRSRDLHDGIAFPWVLCEPPHPLALGVPPEKVWALGASGRGGQWTADQLPMYLHVFAYLVGEALRMWSATLPSVDRPDTAES